MLFERHTDLWLEEVVSNISFCHKNKRKEKAQKMTYNRTSNLRRWCLYDGCCTENLCTSDLCYNALRYLAESDITRLETKVIN